ncbi:sigma 54-interacting transcriptional regulator [Dehalobacter sp. DCM]|uniref:sigma-54 interaction domain-containing protein n=1 Tax=Dehalobacter sp. DCM TaxID=2907827 RepID=UPI003081D993|nr:sigma 54-interacting transcriptional regulator [Dehalobacter sp. DCM]
MDKRIAASWLRCYRKGMFPDTTLLIEDRHERENVLLAIARNEGIIEAAKSVFDEIYHYQEQNGTFDLELVDRDNIRILERWVYIEAVYANPIPGENILGTNCHSLMREYHCPIQLCGPENYQDSRGKHLVWGAPIFDEAGNYYAAVFLTKRLESHEWIDMAEDAQLNKLHFVCTIALAIEHAWKAIKIKNNLEKKMVYRLTLQDFILNQFDDGMLTMDRDGYIIDINQQAMEILGIADTEKNKFGKLLFTNYYHDPKTFLMIMQRGKPAHFDGSIIKHQTKKKYSFRFTPFPMKDSTERVYASLCITAKEKSLLKAENAIGMITKFSFDNIIGQSPAIKETIKVAKTLARSNENILLTGESGTGKELFAQAIHSAYNTNGPFIALNCAAFPRSLIESELFGYEQGTFTGAEKNGRPGKIELADGGTLFLDEIGDMPVDIQAILLRVLQDKQVVRLGSVKYKTVDFRVIAATNQNLKQLITERKFRQDLYFRLSVLSLNIPPLRERVGDVELLSRYFLEKYCKKNNLPVPEVMPEVQRMFHDNQWPGNVRELENAIAYCVSMAYGKNITTKHVSEDVQKGTSKFRGVLDRLNKLIDNDIEMNLLPSLDEIETIYVKKAMEATNNNVTQAAAMLGISKTTVYRRIKK